VGIGRVVQGFTVNYQELIPSICRLDDMEILSLHVHVDVGGVTSHRSTPARLRCSNKVGIGYVKISIPRVTF